MAHDKVLADHERAHSGQPGSKVRHGADATGGQFLKQAVRKRATGDDVLSALVNKLPNASWERLHGILSSDRDTK